jgi:hypothetical protein
LAVYPKLISSPNLSFITKLAFITKLGRSWDIQ